MYKLVIILLYSRQTLLSSSELPALCKLAHASRAVCAIVCVSAFLLMLAVVLGYRALPFKIVPLLIGLFFCLFLLSAMFASRFGRLSNAEKNTVYFTSGAN